MIFDCYSPWDNYACIGLLYGIRASDWMKHTSNLTHSQGQSQKHDLSLAPVHSHNWSFHSIVCSFSYIPRIFLDVLKQWDLKARGGNIAGKQYVHEHFQRKNMKLEKKWARGTVSSAECQKKQEFAAWSEQLTKSLKVSDRANRQLLYPFHYWFYNGGIPSAFSFYTSRFCV